MGDSRSSVKRKSKPKNSSSSSESKWPLDKRPRSTVHFEYQGKQKEVFLEPPGEDEVTIALDMALEVTSK